MYEPVFSLGGKQQMESVEAAIKPYIDGREIAGQNKNIPLWLKWYKGHDPQFHDYKVYTGVKAKCISKVKKHLPASKIICEAWANMLLNEKTEIKLGESDKKILDDLLKKNKFWKKGNALVEKAFALGIGAFVVRVQGLEVNEEGAVVSKNKAKLKIECINASKIYPITIEDGEITECAFATSNTQNSYITLHLKNEETDEYEITNIFFKDKEFTTADEEKTFTFKTGSDIPWFQIIHPAIVDNEDVDSGRAISIFANHIDEMKSIDNKYDLFDNEFVHGRKKTYISTKLQTYDADGDLVESLNECEDDVMFIPQGEDGRNLIQTDSSDLRTSQCVEALNSELSMLGYACGFGKGYLAFNTESSGRPIQTATASMMQNNDLFRSCHKHEQVLEEALHGLVEAIIYASNEYTNTQFSSNAADKIDIIFDDSIFEDKEANKNSDRTDVQNGVMSELEYRQKYYGETEEDAKKKLKANPTYIAKQINALLPGLQVGAMTAEQFVEAVWFDKDTALINAIQEKLDQASAITMDDLNPDKEEA